MHPKPEEEPVPLPRPSISNATGVALNGERKDNADGSNVPVDTNLIQLE